MCVIPPTRDPINPNEVALAPVTEHRLSLALRLVDASGVVGVIEKWRAEDVGARDKTKGGRPRTVALPTRAVVALGLLTYIEREPFTISQMTTTVARRFTDAQREKLGVTKEDFDPRDGRDIVRVEKLFYDRVWRGMEEIRQVIEPYPEVSRHARYTVEEFLPQYMKIRGGKHSDEERAFVAQRRARMTEFGARMLWASIQILVDKKTLKQWDGTVIVDGTVVNISNNGNPSKRTFSLLPQSLRTNAPTKIYAYCPGAWPRPRPLAGTLRKPTTMTAREFLRP